VLLSRPRTRLFHHVSTILAIITTKHKIYRRATSDVHRLAVFNLVMGARSRFGCAFHAHDAITKRASIHELRDFVTCEASPPDARPDFSRAAAFLKAGKGPGPEDQEAVLARHVHFRDHPVRTAL
jgi:hypothetical protein